MKAVVLSSIRVSELRRAFEVPGPFRHVATLELFACDESGTSVVGGSCKMIARLYQTSVGHCARLAVIDQFNRRPSGSPSHAYDVSIGAGIYRADMCDLLKRSLRALLVLG